jgi:cytochrome c biogenesis protein CcdA
MRKISLFLSFIFSAFSFSSFAQDSVTLNWQFSIKKKKDFQYELTATTSIPVGKFIYLSAPAETGIEPFLSVFSDSSIKVEFLSADKGLKNYTDPLFEDAEVQIIENNIVLKQMINIQGIVPAILRGKFVYTIGGENEFFPGETYEFELPLEGGVSNVSRIRINSIDINKPLVACGDEGTQGKGWMSIFLLGLVGGFIALITPCVFPLIPLTVSFFTKKSGTHRQAVGRASLYGFFIFLIYILLSFPFHLLDQTNPEILNTISTNIWLNLIFFIIFVVFAFSFFGYFEITLPGTLASGSDSKSSMTSISGIFFMALTLAIVSFSCTGPILGSLLVGALTKEGGAWQLTAGMAGFGVGLALPFALFAMFPQWLQSLPKSGGWLNTIKVVLGFLELAFALKFLIQVDQSMQWAIIKREIIFALWIIIGLGIVLYLLGFIRFPHDDLKPVRTKTRIVFACLFAAITLLLVPGITNTKMANISWVSGVAPTFENSIYKHHVLLENRIKPMQDYDEALRVAREQKKPLLIDFTGWNCANCIKMEENVWRNEKVAELMKEKFVVVSLYVDDRKVLPADRQQTYTTRSGQKKKILTVGDQWATFQSENFEAVAQPQYAIINGDEILLTRTKSYTPEAQEFKTWLECGLKAFEKQ